MHQAEEWNQRSVVLARETGWLEAEANVLVNLGADALHAGRHARARDRFEQAAALIERDEWFSWRHRMRLLIGLGELALAERDPERAGSFAQQALALAEPTTSRKHAGRARLLCGRAMLAAGAPLLDVLAHVQQAQLLACASDHLPLVWGSATELATLHARLGHESDAATSRAEARTAVNAVAERLNDPGCGATFSQPKASNRCWATPES